MKKVTIYREDYQYYFTNYENYHAYIRNAFQINKCENFKSLKDIKNYLIKYCNLKEEEIEIID